MYFVPIFTLYSPSRNIITFNLKMCTTLGGLCVCQITHHANTDIFTALSLLQTLDYIHTHIYTKSQEQTLKKHAHLSGFHFLIKKGYYIQS